MTGRGVDQILPRPCAPLIHEPVVRSAKEYVRLAEKANGPVPRAENSSCIWGAALDELRLAGPHLYIVNLETAITRSEHFLAKGINYRMSPENAECLAAAGIDCCALANNHVLDWGQPGLIETLATLEKLEIKTVGAGTNIVEARTPSVIDFDRNRRVVVYAAALLDSGVFESWVAGKNSPGINVVRELSDASVLGIAGQIAKIRRPGDTVIVSIHWGPNWGFFIPPEQIRFAHRLIDEANVSVVFGHSSHHAKAIEFYRNRLILYGCGDFLNDYEGIDGHEEYRGDLVLLYALNFDTSSNDLSEIELVPFQIRRLQLIRPSRDDVSWLERTLDRECRPFGTSVRLQSSGRFLANPATKRR